MELLAKAILGNLDVKIAEKMMNKSV